MNKHKAKLAGLKRRQRRVRGKVSGTAERPRLRVTRTNANIYAQIIDDTEGSRTLVSASTLEAEFEGCREGWRARRQARSRGRYHYRRFRPRWPHLSRPRQGPRRRRSRRWSQVLGGL